MIFRATLKAAKTQVVRFFSSMIFRVPLRSLSDSVWMVPPLAVTPFRNLLRVSCYFGRMQFFLLLLFILPSYGQQVAMSSLRTIYYAPEQILSKKLKALNYKLEGRNHDSQNKYTTYIYQGLTSDSQIIITRWDFSIHRTVQYLVGEQEYDSKLRSLLMIKKPVYKSLESYSSRYEFVYSPIKVSYNKFSYIFNKRMAIICSISVEEDD